MAKVIALSGPQGGGKSTLLNGLKERGIAVDDFKVSRAVQAELGWDNLEYATKSPITMMLFQETIERVKWERENLNRARQDVDIILTERSFADIACYTQLWCWELVHNTMWSVADAFSFSIDFIDRCAFKQRIYEGNILLPSMPHVQWQADPNRAKQKDVAFISDQLDRFFEVKNPKSVSLFKVTEGSVQSRIDQVYDWLKKEV